MNNKESVGFALKTSLISSDLNYLNYLNTTVSTSTGLISHNRTNLIWYNVDMQNILGEMYNRYDQFNICLNSFAMSSQASSTTLSPDARTLYIKLRGLQWTTSFNGYTQTPDVILNTVKISTTASDSFVSSFNSPQYYTFTKSSGKVNMTIQLHSVDTDDFDDILYPLTNSNQLLGQMTFLFNIYGVEKYDVDVMRHRMILNK